MNVYSIGFSGNRIVLPALPKTRQLAIVHDSDGLVLQKIASPLSFHEHLDWPTEELQTTLWVKEGPFWYAVFKYRLVILKYDDQFQLLRQFDVVGDEVNECEARLYSPRKEDRQKFQQLPPHFTDVRVIGKHIYLMCRGALYQIDSHSGETMNKYFFFGTGEDFAQIPPGMRLTLPSFVILNDGTLILAHPAMLWNHDLWIADLKLPINRPG